MKNRGDRDKPRRFSAGEFAGLSAEECKRRDEAMCAKHVRDMRARSVARGGPSALTREEFDERFGPKVPAGHGPSLSERAWAAMWRVRPVPLVVPEWDRRDYVDLGGDVRTAATLKGLWSPSAYRNLDFRDATYRCDFSQLDRAFCAWLTAFRKELARRYIPLVASDCSNVGVCFSLFEDATRTMAPHRGGRWREVTSAEWSVLHGLGLELARVRQVPVTVLPAEPWTFWHCDGEGVVPEPDWSGLVPAARFVSDPAEDVDPEFRSADGRRWFGREPEAAPDWEAALAGLGFPKDEAEAELPAPKVPAAYSSKQREAFERYWQVVRFRKARGEWSEP